MMYNIVLITIGIVVFYFFFSFLFSLKKKDNLLIIDDLYDDTQDVQTKPEIKFAKLNYCHNCKFSKLYPSNKIFCKNETVLNKVYDSVFNGKDEFGFSESEENDVHSILVHGDVDCTIARTVMGRNCSCYVLKENIGFAKETEQ